LVGLILQVEHNKSYPLLLRTLESIKQLLHASNAAFKCLEAIGAIVHRWVMVTKFLKHVGVVLVFLSFTSTIFCVRRVAVFISLASVAVLEAGDL